ncbi:beta-lactamase family protein [Altererythrobacter sp. RZ02]|uniref:Beta-lactamase family protein n=1 Tax=Pontixanthobacter rizhaonensis TaxID=2730337 RepID=A0A848QRW0_9SPHN|nr:serine hydrolase domain-containing protein [Pontixanthobacter rizhaonensis]NMW31848.1 beta-lactamase family protein [Pontixanthobacter rizhaonensis]
MAFGDFGRAGGDIAFSRRSLLRSSAWLTAGAAMSAMPMGRLAFAHDVSESWPNISTMVNSYLDSKKVASMLVTLGDGQEDHAHTIGGGTLALGDSTPIDEDSLFRIYSMTKPITGMATMMLIDEGLLGLDQPVGEILPAFADMQVLVDPEGSLEDTVPADRPITIRHLLTHTAGIGYLITSKGPLGQAFVDQGLVGGRVSRFPIPGLPNVTPAPNLEEWADRLATLPLMAQPGTEWIYSASIDLLGRVIEVVSGQSFESFLQTRLFDPCGMSSTYFTVPKSEAGRLTTNYGIAGGLTLPIDTGANSIFLDAPFVPSGGGGLVSSAKDYDRFLRMVLGYGLLDGERVMSESAVRVGTSNLLPDAVDTSTTWIAGEGHGAGGRVVGKQYGWGGAAGTLASVDFSLNKRVCLFTQYMPTEAYPIRKEFLAAIQADLKNKLLG